MRELTAEAMGKRSQPAQAPKVAAPDRDAALKLIQQVRSRAQNGPAQPSTPAKSTKENGSSSTETRNATRAPAVSPKLETPQANRAPATPQTTKSKLAGFE